MVCTQPGPDQRGGAEGREEPPERLLDLELGLGLALSRHARNFAAESEFRHVAGPHNRPAAEEDSAAQIGASM